jgi:hypothetical protein
MTQITIDGNYQSFRYGKNSDTEDRSLFHGKSYFEEDGKLEQDLQNAKTVANRSARVRVPTPFFFQINFSPERRRLLLTEGQSERGETEGCRTACQRRFKRSVRTYHDLYHDRFSEG